MLAAARADDSRCHPADNHDQPGRDARDDQRPPTAMAPAAAYRRDRPGLAGPLDDRLGQPTEREAGLAEFGQELVRAWPPAGILVQAALDQGPGLGGRPAQVRRVMDQPVDEGGTGSGTERPFA